MKIILKALIFLLFMAGCAEATTYYVREDGGDTTECLGTTDAPYDGEGTGEACAWNHPWWAIPPAPSTINISSGDTLIISPTTGAGYQLGVADGLKAERNASGGCNAYYCVSQTVPSGIDINNKTKIYGKGWDTGCSNPPELWGSGYVYQLIQLGGNDNIDLRCLELTDRYEGVYNSKVHPSICRSSPPWDQNTVNIAAIYSDGSTNIIMKDLYIHGICSAGIKMGNADNWLMEDVRIEGNAFVGIDGCIGSTGNFDNMTFNNVNIDWNGCMEEYPIVNSVIADRMTECYSPGQGGYGDGIGLCGGTCSNWVMNDSSVSYNTSDGIDLLYCQGGASDTLTVKRSIVSSNAGNQIKTGGGQNLWLEDSVVIGSCGYFDNGQSGKDCDAVDCGGNNFVDCRAFGTAIIPEMAAGTTIDIVNSTITNEGSIVFSAEGSTCDGTEEFNVSNSLILGEEYWNSIDSLNTVFNFNVQSGTCSTYPTSVTLSDSYVVNMRDGDPGGTNVVYNTDPDLTGLAIVIDTTGSITPTNEDDVLENDGLKPKVGGAILGLSDETVVGADANDFYNQARGAAWDLGALEYETGSGPVCGNDTTESGETCDGTDVNSYNCVTVPGSIWDGGTLACSGNCLSYDTSACTIASCGNASIDVDEDCDTNGPLLDGQTCITQGFASGTLACTANTCLFDTSSCVAHACQDGVIEEGVEDCDDGNAAEGDGCSSLCTLENPNYELFLNATDTDPNSRTTIEVHKNNIAIAGRDESANLKLDKGAAFFGDFVHHAGAIIDVCDDGGPSAIAYDAGSEKAESAASSVTFSHTVAAGSNRLLIVTITREEIGTDRSVSSVTFDGQAMTFSTAIETGNGQNKVSQYYLLNPNQTTANVVITYSGQVGSTVATADSYTGIAQQAPEVVNTADNAANSFTTFTDGALAVQSIVAAISTATLSTSDTERHNLANPGEHIMGVSETVIPTAGLTNMTWSVSTGAYVGAVSVFAPADTGGTIAGIMGIWAVGSSSHADFKAQETAGDGMMFYLSCLGSAEQNTWTLVSPDVDLTTDTFVETGASGTRYFEIERSSTTVTVKIYSDQNRTNLLDTLTKTTLATTHQYIIMGGTYNDSTSGTSVTGSVFDYDLTAEGAPEGTPATESFEINGYSVGGSSMPNG